MWSPDQGTHPDGFSTAQRPLPRIIVTREDARGHLHTCSGCGVYRPKLSTALPIRSRFRSGHSKNDTSIDESLAAPPPKWNWQGPIVSRSERILWSTPSPNTCGDWREPIIIMFVKLVIGTAQTTFGPDHALRSGSGITHIAPQD